MTNGSTAMRANGDRAGTRVELRRTTLWLAMVALAAGIGLACSGENLTLPGEGVPTALIVMSGDEQTAAPGQALPESLVVKVVDQNGHAVPGAVVHWEAEGGTATPESVPADSTGRAATQRILGGSAGRYATVARVQAGIDIHATFSSIAVGGTSGRVLALATQPSATAVAGSAFTRQPVLQIQDADGRPVGQDGVAVVAAVASGGGRLGGTTTRMTDAGGRATFTDLSIGGATGTHTLIFAASGIASVTSGTIEVAGGGGGGGGGQATTIAIRAGDGQTARAGSDVAVRPSVIVTDGAGQPVQGVAVTFVVTSGGGYVSGGSRTSGSNGVASAVAWTLGRTPGTNTLRASAAGITRSVTFTATGLSSSGVVATRLIFLVQPSEVKEGATMQPAVKVALVDQDGRIVSSSDATITLELNGDQATLKGTRSVETSGGVATFSDLNLDKIDGQGTFRLQATTRGLPAAESAQFVGHD
jgi:hypothetical protein